MVALTSSLPTADLAALQRSLTESMEIRPTDRAGYTFAEFEALTSDIIAEYVDGAIVLNPPPNFPHQAVLSQLHESLFLQMRHRPGPESFVQGPFGLDLHDPTWGIAQVIPDAAIVADRNVDRATLGPEDILLVVEVLSPSNQRKDTVRNVRLYGGAGIAEYWIVDQATRTIHVHSDPTDSGYQRHHPANPGDIIHSIAVEGLEILVNDVFGQDSGTD